MVPVQQGRRVPQWYGNHEFVVNWENDGAEIRRLPRARSAPLCASKPSHLLPTVCLMVDGSSRDDCSFRYFPQGSCSTCRYVDLSRADDDLPVVFSGTLNSRLASALLAMSSPTLEFQTWDLWHLRVSTVPRDEVVSDLRRRAHRRQGDWDCYETSWDFDAVGSASSGAGSLETACEAVATALANSDSPCRELEDRNNTDRRRALRPRG